MKRGSVLLIAGAVLACNDTPGDPGPGNGDAVAAIRFLHTVTDVPAVDVLVDGSVVLAGLEAGKVSAFVPLDSGARQLAFRPAGATGAVPTHTLSLVVGDSLTILTIDSSTVLNPWVLTDTGGVVPANRTKVRALHFAANAGDIDIWRTQPDFQDPPYTFMFPHNYGEITPYVESDPGNWRVIVSTRQRDGMGIPVLKDTLLITAPIPVPAGASRTVIILDAAGGGVTYQVIDP